MNCRLWLSLNNVMNNSNNNNEESTNYIKSFIEKKKNQNKALEKMMRELNKASTSKQKSELKQ